MAENSLAISRLCFDWQAIERALVGPLAMAKPAEDSPNEGISADSRLVEAAIGGDGDAFARIVDAYQTTLAQQLRRFSRDPLTIEELVHEVFVEAYFSLRTYRGASNLLNWLRKIAVRVGYRYWKQKAKTQTNEVNLSGVGDQLEQTIEHRSFGAAEASELLGELLEALAPRDRLVLTLLYWDGCSISEAAELTGWSQAMVKVQAYRARNRLRKVIEESMK